MRTVMVTNIPPLLRSEKDLKEYFEYYLTKEIAKPTIGITSTTRPGFFNKSVSFLLNRARGFSTHARPKAMEEGVDVQAAQVESELHVEAPVVERVVIVRKMNNLASLLERREEVQRLLETAHIRLARRVLGAVVEAKQYIYPPQPPGPVEYGDKGKSPEMEDVERAMPSAGQQDSPTIAGEDRMSLLVRTLGNYVTIEDFAHPPWYRSLIIHLSEMWKKHDNETHISVRSSSPEREPPSKTVWDALLSLPRSTLDPYQPLIYLSALFRGQAVPSIDYYTAKLDVLTSLITEKRAMPLNAYQPTSTAFVTFADPADARRACKYLAAHPANPMQCFVTMAPAYEDLEWKRLMRSTFRVEVCTQRHSTCLNH